MRRTDRKCSTVSSDVSASTLRRRIEAEADNLTDLRAAFQVSKREVFLSTWKIIRSLTQFYCVVIEPVHISFVQLAKAGFEGRDKALTSFDPDGDRSFGDYMVFCVETEIKKALRDAGDMIRVRLHVHSQYPHLAFPKA